MRVYFSNLGCKLNQAELESMQRRFRAAGHQIVARLEEAELHVVNSCTVTHQAARSSRKVARRGGRLETPAKTVMTGCWVADPKADLELGGAIDLVVPNDQKHELLERVHAAFPDQVPQVDEIPVSYVPIEFGHARAMVKIEDGCNMRCSYCIIPFTRGRQRSRSTAEVLDELVSLESDGYREIVLTGVQISHYENAEGGLFELVAAALDRLDEARLRITSIAPWRFDTRLLQLFDPERLCRHIHLSLQSGSDQTLKRMRRPYSTESYAKLVDSCRERVPEMAITTDVIVGFPGETDEDFQVSLDFVRAIGFARAHTFPFSPRAGTEAETLEGQLPPPVIAERMRAMLELAEGTTRKFAAAHQGRSCSVLWERHVGGVLEGLSDTYQRISAPGPASSVGSIEAVDVVAVDGDIAVAELKLEARV